MALALSRAGNVEEAQKLADALDQEYPLDTAIQYYYLPTIRAAIKLNEKDPASAVEILRPALKYDLAYPDSFQSLYPAYIRGLAYLSDGRGPASSSGVPEAAGSSGLDRKRCTRGSITFAVSQGAEIDGRRSRVAQIV